MIMVEVDSEDRWIGRYIDRGKETGMGRQKETESGLSGVFLTFVGVLPCRFVGRGTLSMAMRFSSTGPGPSWGGGEI